jgi:SAM-dependent methyltransferase
MLTRCPICDGRVLSLFDKVDVAQRGVASIYICRTCLALLNGAAYDALGKGEVEDLQKTEYYSVAIDEPASVHLEKVATYQQILQLFFQEEERSLTDLTFLDFGCGRGYAALAAAARCRRAVACDYDLGPFRSVLASLRDIGACPNNIASIHELSSTTERFDLAFMWHVLEHLPYPTAFWRDNRARLQPRAALIIQLPMFRPEYVIDAHFVFYTESSLQRWMDEIGAVAVKFSYDVPRAFIALHARLVNSGEPPKRR